MAKLRLFDRWPTFLVVTCLSFIVVCTSISDARDVPAGAKSSHFRLGAVTWQDLAAAFTWPVLRPAENLGLHLKRLEAFSTTCDSDTDYQAYTALYGAPRARSFSLYIGKGHLCGDGPESGTVAHVVVHGHRVTVDVPLFSSPSGDVATPTLADGYQHGMSLYWKQGSTVIDVEGTHLHLAELVRIARSLRAIPG